MKTKTARPLERYYCLLEFLIRGEVMEVYIKGEMPKSCLKCPCFSNELDFPCALDDGTKDYYLDDIEGGECPLHSLKEYKDKQLAELEAKIKKQEDLIEKGNQKLLDYYNQKIYELDKDYNEDLEERLKENEALKQQIYSLEEQLKNAIVLPEGYGLGQIVYMIPTKTNALRKTYAYRLMSFSKSDIGCRANLSLITKEKGIEPLYCASFDMFGECIFPNMGLAEEKRLAELEGK